MTRPKVVLHPRHPRGVDQALAALDIDLIVPESDEIPDMLEGSGILVTFVWEDRFLQGLRWLQSISAGHDQFPHQEFERHGVVLTSASGVHASQMAEHAFALLLGLTRGVGAATRNATERTWKPMMLTEISGLTMGVLGLGAIGEEVAGRAHAWGMRVIGTKRDPATYTGVADEVFGPDGTATVFATADVVVSVLPGGDSTDGIVTREMLESLDGWFVNIGRGNVVDEQDIIAAIDAGGLKGAGLDVFDTEPLPEQSPLWTHPRVIVTPHVGGFSPHYGSRLAAIFERNLAAYAGHGEWHNRVV